MARLETMAVFNKKGHAMNINASDFDPKLHLLEEPEAKKAEPNFWNVQPEPQENDQTSNCAISGYLTMCIRKFHIEMDFFHNKLYSLL